MVKNVDSTLIGYNMDLEILNNKNIFENSSS